MIAGMVIIKDDHNRFLAVDKLLQPGKYIRGQRFAPPVGHARAGGSGGAESIDCDHLTMSD
jgi:hypothetical protein